MTHRATEAGFPTIACDRAHVRNPFASSVRCTAVAGLSALTSATEHSRWNRCFGDPLLHRRPASTRWHLQRSIRVETGASM